VKQLLDAILFIKVSQNLATQTLRRHAAIRNITEASALQPEEVVELPPSIWIGPEKKCKKGTLNNEQSPGVLIAY
jgi:hypothetical protein